MRHYGEDNFEFRFESLDRILAGDEYSYGDEGYSEKDSIDYTILNYGIWTLYLILFVELVRHTIDHAAHGRPFFTVVLSMAYSELATLGIVEFAVFLWGKFGDIPKDMKKKFADVHFALFFTAIFNAFQYGLTSIFSTRRSNKMWVKTEQVELDHYVEIREEYDRVNEIITNQYKGFLGKLVLFAGRSGLRRRHEMLRVQVKFHELRLHFLQSNNLPVSLKVSDYLKRSELSILIGLVHVSAATWVLLIALMNLAYFSLGMIEIKTLNPGISTRIMFGILFSVDFLFIALSLAFRWKMRHIFQKELHETVAKHRLKEAEQQRRRKLIEKALVNDSSIIQTHTEEIAGTRSKSIGVDEEKKTPLLVSDLVKIDTKKLRNSLPEESRENLINREERIRQRRANRKKSLSDGVAVMRGWNQPQGTHLQDKKEVGKPKHRSRIRKTTSQPGVIQGWQKITAMEQQKTIPRSLDDTDATRVTKETRREKSNSDPLMVQAWKDSLLLEKEKIGDILLSKDRGPSFVRKNGENSDAGSEDLVPDWKKERNERRAARKRERKRAQSASAVVQSWQDYSINQAVEQKPNIIAEENFSSGELQDLSSDEGLYDKIFSPNLNTARYDEGKAENQSSIFYTPLSLHTLREHEVHEETGPHEGGTLEVSGDGKAVIDLSEAVIIEANKKDGNTDDDGTVDTGKSIGNLSDVDVIEAESVGMTSYSKKALDESDVSFQTALIQKTRHYFIGPVYQNASHVLGTSLVFYLVGYRVELFRQTQDKESEFKKVWFWMEAAFFLCFIVADFIIVSLFPFWKAKTGLERQLIIATFADLFIVTTVMTLFFVAEAKRCCANESEVAQTSSRLERDIEDDFFVSECTCQSWGMRTFGGIGIIEPLTSLIVLRIFRFQFAQFVERILSMKTIAKKTTDDSIVLCDTQHNDNDVPLDHHDNVHGHGSNVNAHKAGTALELWELAMAEFPDIVEKYGQFSGELLQAMLGLQIAIRSPGLSTFEHPSTSDIKHDKNATMSKSEKVKSHIKLTGSRHAKLHPRAQALIIAGQLGKPVKPMNQELCMEVGTTYSASIYEENTPPDGLGLVEFEVDCEQIKSELNSPYTFVAPFARLVRSMRRCDRRHLPLLKAWIGVDVVMTQFEIVYFEAIDSYDSDLDEKTKNHTEACRIALQATKGGKNLRLCDVARGRKVVGHIDFTDVTEIHVEKDDIPISDISLVELDSNSYDNDKGLNVEHWLNCRSENEEHKKYPRCVRWSLFQEDRLKLSTRTGTLYFRFYSDLALFETEKAENHQISNRITPDIAFQWAETICRICGRGQLDQSLPHFGENNEAQLQDYLEIVHFHQKEAEDEMRASTRGVKSVSKRKLKHQRTKSMMDLSSAIIDEKSTVAFGSAEMSSTPGNGSGQSTVPKSKRLHRVSKSMNDFSEVARTQLRKGPPDFFYSATESNDVDKKV
eukprot:jgi/Psemu1/263564/estExt_Genewise1Plus.C_10800001